MTTLRRCFLLVTLAALAASLAVSFVTWIRKSPRVGAAVLAADVDDGGVVRLRLGDREACALETVSVARTDRPATTSPATAVFHDEDGSVRIERAHVEERIARHTLGLEQSWSFAERPAGDGALRLRIRTRRCQLRAAPRGAVLGGPDARVTYEAASWVDATGARTPLVIRVDGNDLTMDVPREVVDASAFPAVLDPILSPEIDMDGPQPRAPFLEANGLAGIAWNGSVYLAVYGDVRSDDRVHNGCNPGIPCQHNSTADIYGVLVAADGSVADPAGFLIELRGYRAAVASDGTNFLVMTEKGVRRVSASGKILDAVPRAVLATPGPYWSIGFDGTNYIVVGGPSSKYAQFVSPSGALVGAPFEVTPPGEPSSTYTNVACGDGTCLVAWIPSTPNAGRETHARARFVSAGSPSGDAFDIDVALDGSPPIVSYDGARFYVFGAGPKAVDGGATAYVLSGAPADASAFDIARIEEPNNGDFGYAVDFDGTKHLVTWWSNGNVLAQYVLGDGGLVSFPGADGGAKIAEDGGGPPKARCAGATCLVAWSHYDNPILAARINGGVQQSPGRIEMTRYAANEHFPAASTDGTEFLVAWHDDRDSGAPILPPGYLGDVRENAAYYGDIRGTRIDAHGSILSTTVLSGAGTAWARRPPRAAFGGGRHFVVWAEWDPAASASNAIHGVRVAASGASDDNPSLRVLEAADSPALAFDGAAFLVVGARAATIKGALVGPSGPVQKAPIEIAGGSSVKVTPAVAFDGQSYVVVWTDLATDAGRILATRVSTTGTALDFPFLVLSESDASQLLPSAASSPDGTTLVAWEDMRNDPKRASVYGVRLKAGKVLDSAAIKIAAHPTKRDDRPNVLWSTVEQKFLVAWEQGSPNFADQSVVHAAYVGVDGAVGAEETWLDSVYGDVAPAFAFPQTGRPLVAYSEFVPNAPFGSWRVKARLVGPAPAEPDAGAPVPGPSASAGSDDDAGNAAPSDQAASSCGCRTSAASPNIVASAGALLGVIALVGRRRKRARRAIDHAR